MAAGLLGQRTGSQVDSVNPDHADLVSVERSSVMVAVFPDGA
jgi:hypothetical protein